MLGNLGEKTHFVSQSGEAQTGGREHNILPSRASFILYHIVNQMKHHKLFTCEDTVVIKYTHSTYSLNVHVKLIPLQKQI